jgi:acyl-CoA synthetase (AMP-forming)/AMP-acid ligase II
MTLAAMLAVDAPGCSTGVTFDDGAFLSYRDLLLGARSTAGALSRTCGVRPGDRVAVGLENTADSVRAALGTWLAGATLVSLPPVPRSSSSQFYADRMSAALAAMGCDVVVANARMSAAFADRRAVVDPAALVGGPPVEHEPPPEALVQFTSGSTGAPRGVAVSGDAVGAHVAAIADHLGLDGERDRALSWLPLAHDMGLIGFLLTSLVARVPLWLQSPGRFVRNPRGWLRSCAQHGVTITGAPDFALRQAIRGLDPDDIGDLGSVRVLLCGGERVSPATVEAFTAATGRAGLRAGAVMPVYGMAEATLAVTMPPRPTPVRVRDDVISVGPPLGPTEVEVDAVTGEILVRSPWLFEGYWSAAGFVPRTSGWYRTKDVGFVEDGDVYVIGRIDEVIVVRGRNVYAEDVETLFMHEGGPCVSGAAAWTTGSGFAVAIECHRGAVFDPRELARDLAVVSRAAFGARIEQVIVCRALTIPRTTSGKPVRSECRRLTSTAAWPADRVEIVNDLMPATRA